MVAQFVFFALFTPRINHDPGARINTYILIERSFSISNNYHLIQNFLASLYFQRKLAYFVIFFLKLSFLFAQLQRILTKCNNFRLRIDKLYNFILSYSIYRIYSYSIYTYPEGVWNRSECISRMEKY